MGEGFPLGEDRPAANHRHVRSLAITGGIGRAARTD
jgi:hypothetical protein